MNSLHGSGFLYDFADIFTRLHYNKFRFFYEREKHKIRRIGRKENRWMCIVHAHVFGEERKINEIYCFFY